MRARLDILALLPTAGRGLAATALVANFVSGLAPVGFIVATSVILGKLPGTIEGGWHSSDGRALVWAIAAAGSFLALGQSLAPFLGVLGQRVARRVDLGVRDRLAAASTATPGIAALEDDELLGYLSEASGELEYNPNTPGRAVAGAIALVNRYVPVLAASVLVAVAFSVVGAIALLAGALLIRHGARLALIEEQKEWSKSMPIWRESWYFRGLALDPPAAKELRVFGLPGWVRGRHRAAVERAWALHWPVRRRGYWSAMSRYAVVAALAAAATLAYLGHQAATGAVTLAETALVLQAAVIVIRVGMHFIEVDGPLEFGMGANRALQAFERESERRFGAQAADGGVFVPVLREAIRFEGVSFTYPGSDRPALHGLDLEIPAGRSLAIVGLNGAGKTTLVKLLTRLYEPDEGHITIDGTDIAGLDLRAWRRSIAALFQDYVRYELPAADNVGFGSLELRGDEAAVLRAVERAGGSDVLEALPEGLATPLSSRYSGGVDLSGGQWQRVALARGLFALAGGASVLLLDEPTASLDVRAELELFDRLLEVTHGVTTVLVSHRFSTVRRADRIAVISEGRVAEQGAHDELVAGGGLYAELFRLQAARFREGEE
jgi:ATP-binding cassette, subfamily B, bacterial